MPAKRAHTMIAETLGWDSREVSDHRYQGYTAPSVYSIGNRYFAAHPTKPKHEVGGEWREHADQFGARGSSYIIWSADVS